MINAISYNVPGQIGYVGTTTVNTSETTLLTISDLSHIRKSQLTAFFDVTFGASTSSVKLRYYYSPDSGVTWYLVPTKNVATGLVADLPTTIDTTFPTVSTLRYRMTEDIPISGTTQIKITAQAVTAAATLNALYVYGRDN